MDFKASTHNTVKFLYVCMYVCVALEHGHCGLNNNRFGGNGGFMFYSFSHYILYAKV